jgi:hypothetical protein
MKILHANFPTRLVEAMAEAGLTFVRPVLFTVKEEVTGRIFYATR